jgi:uncharacterized protein YegJ (DUF2314 family)
MDLLIPLWALLLLLVVVVVVAVDVDDFVDVDDYLFDCNKIKYGQYKIKRM